MELDFFVPIENKKTRVQITGKVARVVDLAEAEKDKTQAGMGVRFENPSNEGVVIISSFVNNNLPEGGDEK